MLGKILHPSSRLAAGMSLRLLRADSVWNTALGAWVPLDWPLASKQMVSWIDCSLWWCLLLGTRVIICSAWKAKCYILARSVCYSCYLRKAPYLHCIALLEKLILKLLAVPFANTPLQRLVVWNKINGSGSWVPSWQHLQQGVKEGWGSNRVFGICLFTTVNPADGKLSSKLQQCLFSLH